MLERARSLRTHQTDAEQRLWTCLRAHRFMNLKFKRQKPVGNYIVDFVCHAPMLVVEIDGAQHAGQATYDQRRDDFLRGEGFAVLRFWNNEVLNETDAVLELIRLTVISLAPMSSPPAPLPHAGEGSS